MKEKTLMSSCNVHGSYPSDVATNDDRNIKIMRKINFGQPIFISSRNCARFDFWCSNRAANSQKSVDLLVLFIRFIYRI